MAMNGNNKITTEKQKMIQEKCLAILTNMLKDEDNKYCVDCDAKGPRWASWNLGVFLCIRCAGIHRNLGVHISKVKSVNLDTWKPEQAVALQQMGNSRARAVYEANLPDNFRRPQTDSALEAFIRAKYEHNKYTAREWVPPRLPKVNWDAEIEAAMKEQRSARKTGRGRVEVPAPVLSKESSPAATPQPLPPASAAASRDKPAKAADPPPAAAPAAAAPAASAAADLLGLDSPAAGGNDPFGDFLAAAPAPDSTAAATAVSSADSQLASDEANFFNQAAPAATAAGGSLLSRDSILALYGAGGGGAAAGAGGGSGLAGFPAMPSAVSSAGYPAAMPAGAVTAGGFHSLPVASSAAGYGGIPAVSSAGYGGMPAVSSAAGYGSMPAVSSAGYGGMPVASSAAGFPAQQPGYHAGAQQQFSMGYPAAQQQQQQFAGLQQHQQFQQAAPYQQPAGLGYQQQQQQYAAPAYGQPFAASGGVAPQQQAGFSMTIHQQMAGLSMGHPPMSAAAPVSAPGSFPAAMGTAAPLGSMGGPLWQ